MAEQIEQRAAALRIHVPGAGYGHVVMRVHGLHDHVRVPVRAIERFVTDQTVQRNGRARLRA